MSHLDDWNIKTGCDLTVIAAGMNRENTSRQSLQQNTTEHESPGFR